ncbi:hypothetical protein BJV78DRAFT_466436 [Lactifluus subvellereus]|nr:hypothetical protein BJV78DRAFT_466436 [Lactifluus subvellereus]
MRNVSPDRPSKVCIIEIGDGEEAYHGHQFHGRTQDEQWSRTHTNALLCSPNTGCGSTAGAASSHLQVRF